MSKTKKRLPRKAKPAQRKRSRTRSRRPAPPAERLYSINALNEELGIDRRTLKKHLVEVQPVRLEGKSKLYRLEDVEAVFTAVDLAEHKHAELVAEQIRQQTRAAKARAELLEMDQKERSGQLVSLEEVAAIVNPILLTVRQRLNAMPSELANLVNPTDPVHAQQQALAWVQRALPLIRQELPQPAKAAK